ncbi:hypothetical protein Fmac_012817 [Flemingia macrophylla]|uniref:Uncharacterized protein n=1 Tax=Flemingia macrophylla TaxID=520843 RepID=A0ABD1MRT1_9FABA
MSTNLRAMVAHVQILWNTSLEKCHMMGFVGLTVIAQTQEVQKIQTSANICQNQSKCIDRGPLQEPSGISSSPIPNNYKQMPKAVPKVIVDNKKSLIKILVSALSFISLLSLVFAMSIFFTYKGKVYKYATLYTTENLGFTEECSLRSFSFDELEKSTGGFTEEIGRGSFGAVYREEILLCSWAYQCFAAGQLDKLVTENEGVDWMLLERMVKVGLWCVQNNPHLRPSIKNVILMLQGLKDIPIPPSPAHLPI